MTNVAITGGLQLYKQKQAQELMQCVVLAGDSTILGIGDPVVISAGGATSVGSGPICQAVTRAAASSVIYGVVEGVLPLTEGTGAINLGIRYRPASTAQYVLIRLANNVDEYTITDDGSAAMSAANIGNNANIVVANCSTGSGMSNVKILASTVASGNASFPLKISGIVDNATNDVTSTGCRWIVTINNATQSGGTGTAGT